MDDELHSPGLSGYAGYALGRMSAQNERALGDFGRALQRRFRPVAPTVDVGALIAENEMLRRQLADTEADFSLLQGNHTRLKAWAIQASQALDELGFIDK